jgi:hypothetical protein
MNDMQKPATRDLISALDEMRSVLRPLDRDCVTLSEAVVRRVELNDGPRSRLIRDLAESVRAAVASVETLRESMRSMGDKINRRPT